MFAEGSQQMMKCLPRAVKKLFVFAEGLKQVDVFAVGVEQQVG